MYGLGSSRILIKLILTHGIDPKYLPRLLRILLISFCTSPVRALEKIAFSQKIKHQKIEQSPIFIIGHWRSGTSHLQQVLAQDPNLGYLSVSQAIAHDCFLIGNKFVPLINLLLPKKRIYDNMDTSLSFPGEEEFALANTSDYSMCHGAYFFPRSLDLYLKQYVLFEGVSQKLIADWKNTYLNIVKKTAFNRQGKRLLLKNPANTARIKILLEIFPDAKFIHIYRNPYNVFASRLKQYQIALKKWGFQTIDEITIEKNIFRIYQRIMGKFLQDKNLIPSQNLIEIKFEDFELNPNRELKKIYNQLKIGNFQESEKMFMNYFDSLKYYQKNCYQLDSETLDKIYNNWKFTIDKWHYDVPEELQHKILTRC